MLADDGKDATTELGEEAEDPQWGHLATDETEAPLTQLTHDKHL